MLYKVVLKDKYNSIHILNDKAIERKKEIAQTFLIDIKQGNYDKYLTKQKLDNLLYTKKGLIKDFSFLKYSTVKDFKNLKKLISFIRLVYKANQTKNNFTQKGIEYINDKVLNI